jgi:hypothetical protein
MSMPVVPVTVVVAFYSRCGTTETRALTAAVGSVNARALIRMRRMPDAPGEPAAGCAAETARMRKEYVAPTEADIAGADALIVAAPPDAGVSAAEWTPLTHMLEALAARGQVRGKVAAVVGGGDAGVNLAFASRLEGLGFVLVPVDAVAAEAGVPGSPSHARAHGRLVAETSRKMKPGAAAPVQD